MTHIYDYAQLLELLRQGGRVEKDGTYALWVWAPQGSQVCLRVEGQELPLTHTGAPARRCSWAMAGQVALRKGARFSLGLRAQQPLGREGAPFFLALSSEAGFDPQRSFETTRVFLRDPGPAPDERLGAARDTDTPWALRAYATREAWEERAAHIRAHLLVCLGLWPLPEKTPLKPKIASRIEREGYGVEKVYFESFPGFFVCGNLYRPAGRGPFPGILCPHGHWKEGRLEDANACSVPGRCINLARQGHAVFAYDMAGYLDSDQVLHRNFGGAREELWGIGLMGLQLWNSIRGVDFLLSLGDVDPGRIGCTGASGGGTQTFALTAVDERVKAAAPVNMVSAHMQGGCVCENQGHLRLEINNVEIAACMAPRPLLLVSATGDWTCNTPEVEYPAIRAIYRLCGAEERLSQHQVDAGHNYNKESREAVYAFFGKWFLGIDDPEPLREQPFTVEKREDLLVFNGQPRPAHALDAEGVVKALIERSEKRLQDLIPADGPGLSRFRKAMEPALGHALGAEWPAPGDLYVRNMGRSRREGVAIQRLLLGRREQGERIPALLFLPRPARQGGPATLVVHPRGKAALAEARRGQPGQVVAGLLERGHAVLVIDPFLEGEFQPPLGRAERDERVRHFATYNQSTAACRVQDILTTLSYLDSVGEGGALHLLGVEEAGPWCLLARALAPRVKRAAIDFNFLEAHSDRAWAEALFVPAIRSAGDVRAAAALSAPGELLVHQTGRHFPEEWARKAYRAAGREENLVLHARRLKWETVLEWLTRE